MRSCNRRRRTSTRTAASVAVVAVVAFTVAACTTGSPGPLPGSDREVSSDAPLTAEQAGSVRDAGRQLTRDLVGRLPAADRGIDTARSTERWGSCTARQKGLSFHPTINGVLYRATIFLSTSNNLTIDQMHAKFDDLAPTWNRDDGEKGTRGVFTIRLNAGELPLGITISSPCYYLRDVDGISVRDKEQVTGFSSRKWNE